MQRAVPVVITDDADVAATVMLFTAACASISVVAFNEGKPLAAIALQRVVYADLKALGLNAQMACSACRRVAGAYVAARRNKRPATKPFSFSRPTALWLIGDHGRDARVREDGTLSIWTLSGRKRVVFRVPDRRTADFDAASEYDALQVSVDRDGTLRATIVVTLPEPTARGTHPVGIDLNETNAVVAVDADDRELFLSGKEAKVRNRRTFKTGKQLQRKLAALKAHGRTTKSVGRLLKRLGTRNRRRTIDQARCRAKQLCAWATADAVLVIEDLKLPQPTKQRKAGKSPKRVALRRRLSGFAYAIARAAIESRAQRTGMLVVAVDPWGTSQRCNRCGRNGDRKRHRFTCPACGNSDHADRNAARNIRDLYRADPARWAPRQGAQEPPQSEASPGFVAGVT